MKKKTAIFLSFIVVFCLFSLQSPVRATVPFTYDYALSNPSYTYGSSNANSYLDTMSSNDVSHASSSAVYSDSATELAIGVVHTVGYSFSGAVSDTYTSNDVDYVSLSDVGGYYIDMYFYSQFTEGTKASATAIAWTVEGEAFASFTASIYVWNWTSSSWRNTGKTLISGGDNTATGSAVASTDMAANGTMRIRLYQDTTPTAISYLYIDYIKWVVTYNRYRADFYYQMQFIDDIRSNVAGLDWSVEGATSSPSATIYIYNFDTSAWDNTTKHLTSSETTQGTVDVNISRYMSSAGYMRIRFYATGVSSTFTVSVDWIYWKVTYASDVDIYVSFSNLDGWGMDFNKVKAFINGSRMVEPHYAFPNSLGRHVNFTACDYFNNPVYSKIYVLNDTPTFLDVQLQLVSTTVQSYGLTNVEIFGNVTLSDTFNGNDGLAPDATKWLYGGAGGAWSVSMLNNRLRVTTNDYARWYMQPASCQPTCITMTVWARALSPSTDRPLYIIGTNNGAGADWWGFIYDATGGNWVTWTRQGGGTVWGAWGGTPALDTWFKIVIVLTSTRISMTAYNVDGTVDFTTSTWYDAMASTWNLQFYSVNVLGGTCTADWDLFIVQGNTGYSKTISFSNFIDDFLLMPDDYVFNGTAWNGAIRFQTSATISVALNRFVQLIEDVRPSSLIFYKADGTTLPRNSFNVTVFNTLYPASVGGFSMGFEANSFLSRISENTHIHVYDLFNNLIVDTDYGYSSSVKINVDTDSVKVYLKDDALGYFYFRRDGYSLPCWHEWIWGQVDYFEAQVYDGLYRFDVWYQNASLPLGGVWCNYTINITGDYAIIISSNLVWDIYSAVLDHSTGLTNLVVAMNEQLYHIWWAETDVETALNNVHQLQQDMNGAITEIGDQQLYEWILMCAMGLGVLVTFITIAVKGRPKIDFGPPYRHK